MNRSITDTRHGIGEVLEELSRGGPNPRCQWNEDVCSETPEYYIVEPGSVGDDGDSVAEADAATYCLRHYVLKLAWMLEVHLSACAASAADHIKRFGALS